MSDLPPPTADDRAAGINQALAVLEEPATIRNAPGMLAELAWQARAVAKSVTLPQALQNKPADILAVMLAGRELGIGPMAATRMVHIINGQTSVATELKLALALKAGHDIAPLSEGDGWCQVNCRSHPESSPVGWMMKRQPSMEGDLTAWTIAGEIMQGTKRLVDKDNWRNYQRDMLFWRAASQFMRRHCPGLAGGLYTLEELGGEAEDAEV